MTIPVIDPFGAAGDRGMPTLAPALNPVAVQGQFGRGLPRLAGEHGLVHPRAIRVIKHRPGRRCVIEYDVEVERPDALPATMTLIGKVRARHSGRSGYRLLTALWCAGFQDDSRDGVSVPEPIGVIPPFQLWLQRKVPGIVATDLLTAPGGAALARRIAEAAHKLHQVGVPTHIRHTMADELGILRECLPAVVEEKPRWARRIERLLRACADLAAAMPAPAPRAIHRDFYADQVIVDGSRLHLIDFDLYCMGDPGLDIGNFLGHVTEQSLRECGDPAALAAVEQSAEARFVELAGESIRAAVRGYADLTLVRHIYLSRQFPERRPFTGALLDLCEERLGAALRAHALPS